jgi:hypothetical protein
MPGGFSAIVSRPVFGVALIVPAPTNDTTPVTAGSCATIRRHLGLQRVSFGIEMLCAGLGHRDDHAGVLPRQEPLGHDDIQPRRANQRRRADQQHSADAATTSRANAIPGQQPFEPALGPAREPVGCSSAPGRSNRPHIIGVRVSDTTAETTTATDSVTANSLNSRPTTPVMNSSGNEHRDQRHGQRDDGEADLRRAANAASSGFASSM